MLAAAGVLAESGDGFVVKLGHDDPLPEGMPRHADAFAAEMSERYGHGATEIGLTRRCGAALADALTGQADPLALLFSSGEPTAADLYLKAPVARSANRMLGTPLRHFWRTCRTGDDCGCWRLAQARGRQRHRCCPNCRPGDSITPTRTFRPASSRKRRRVWPTAAGPSNSASWTSRRTRWRRASMLTDTTW